VYLDVKCLPKASCLLRVLGKAERTFLALFWIRLEESVYQTKNIRPLALLRSTAQKKRKEV